MFSTFAEAYRFFQNAGVLSVSTDFSKVFDSVNHNLLIHGIDNVDKKELDYNYCITARKYLKFDCCNERLNANKLLAGRTLCSPSETKANLMKYYTK